MNTCSICFNTYDGEGHDAKPLTPKRCCAFCCTTIVMPLRDARLIARDGAEGVAAFALLMARQRARLSPPGAVNLKDVALLAATVMVSNAVERLALLNTPLHNKGPDRVA